MSAPFVIVGMHRSGTSLVSRILDQSGVFMGLDLQEDHESRFFIELTNVLFSSLVTKALYFIFGKII